MSSFLKREMTHPKVMGLFVGVPWQEIIMKYSVYIQVRFGSKHLDLVWVRGKLIRPEQKKKKQTKKKKQRTATLPAGPS